MKFLVFFFILYVSHAHSFKGQPRELIVMESVSQKTTLELSEIKNVNLENCSQLANLNPDAIITAGRITYKLAQSFGSVENGNCVKVLANQSTEPGFLYLIYKEAETRTRLTIIFNSNQDPKIIFGYGKNKQSSRVLSTF